MKNHTWSYLILTITLTYSPVFFCSPHQAKLFISALSQTQPDQTTDDQISNTSEALYDHANELRKISDKQKAFQAITDNATTHKKAYHQHLDGKSNSALSDLSKQTDQTSRALKTTIKNIQAASDNIRRQIENAHKKIAQESSTTDTKINAAYQAITASDIRIKHKPAVKKAEPKKVQKNKKAKINKEKTPKKAKVKKEKAQPKTA